MDKLLTPTEVAEILGISEITLKRYRLEGTGPQPSFISPRTIRYAPVAETAWLEKRKHNDGS